MDDAGTYRTREVEKLSILSANLWLPSELVGSFNGGPPLRHFGSSSTTCIITLARREALGAS